MLALAGFALVASPGDGAEVLRPVRASGLAAVVEGDLATAFTQAKRTALREAVEQALGTLISSHTRVRNFAVIEDDILSRTAGYVREFAIVEQGPVDSTTYQVVVDAKVSLGDLYRDLDAFNLVIEAAGNPRLVCVGRERIVVDGIPNPSSWKLAAGEIVDVLQRYSDRLDVAVFEQPGGADLAQMQEQARRQGDMVIVADIDIEPARGIPIPLAGKSLESAGIRTAIAHLNLHVSWSDSRETVAVLEGVRKAADSSLDTAARKAVRLGLNDLADELVRRIVGDWREKAYSGRLLRLEIEGNPPAVAVFERELPLRIGAIEKLYPRIVESGLARYDAQSKSAGFQVARELSAKGLEGLDLEIVKVSLNAVRLKLRQAEP